MLRLIYDRDSSQKNSVITSDHPNPSQPPGHQGHWWPLRFLRPAPFALHGDAFQLHLAQQGKDLRVGALRLLCSDFLARLGGLKKSGGLLGIGWITLNDDKLETSWKWF